MIAGPFALSGNNLLTHFLLDCVFCCYVTEQDSVGLHPPASGKARLFFLLFLPSAILAFQYVGTRHQFGLEPNDPFEGLVLPKVVRQARIFFTLAEIQRIIAAASGPLKSFYWLAAETGMRAGELCGLRIEDVDLEQCFVNVKQSVWRGKIQTPKTVNSIRQFAISPKLAFHLRAYLSTWRPNLLNLVFATKNGTPWDQNLIVKRKLHPLLESLGIRHCGDVPRFSHPCRTEDLNVSANSLGVR